MNRTAKTSRVAGCAFLTTLLVGSIANAQDQATQPPAAQPPAAQPPAAQPPAAQPQTSEVLPDPNPTQQTPAPVMGRPAPFPSPPRAEVGFDAGLVARPASGDGPVHYPVGGTVGGHVRLEVLEWLGARLASRFEFSHASFDDGALGLPSGTSIDQPQLRRIQISLMAEPTWRPLPRLLLYVGVGGGWGRTTGERMHTSGAESVVLPSRSAVFVEFPLSVGGRFEIVKNWLVVNLQASASLLIDQSGHLLETYDTPNRAGLLTPVGPFPDQGTSFSLLTGLGLLL
jgi:hypothetical protein